jgi:hypothetical protein
MERELFHVRSFRGPRNAAGFPLGVFSDAGYSNTKSEALAKALSIEDWTTWNQDFDDFNTRFLSTDWTTTKVGTGTQALAAGDGGILELTNSAAGADSIVQTRSVGAFQLAAAGGVNSRPFIFSARVKVDNAANADIVIGMQKLGTTPFTQPTEGIYFKKAASANLSFEFGNASTYTSVAGVKTMVDDTYVILCIAFDGSQVHYGIDNVIKGSLSPANLPVASAMTPTFAVRNNTAVARKLTIDYFFAAKGRYVS